MIPFAQLQRAIAVFWHGWDIGCTLWRFCCSFTCFTTSWHCAKAPRILALIRNAGTDIEHIKIHLVTLHAIAGSIAETCQQEPQLKCTELVLSSLLACKARTEKLNHLVKNIGSDGRAGRCDKGWAGLRATLKDKTIPYIYREQVSYTVSNDCYL